MTRPSGARWSSPGSALAPSTRGRSPRTRRRGGSTRSRPGPKTRKFCASAFARMTSRSHVAEHARGLAGTRARRRRDVDARSRGSPAAAAPRSSAPPLACGLRAHPPLALGRERLELGPQPPGVVEELLGPVASASTPRARRGAPGGRPGPPAAPGAARNVPSTGTPSTSLRPGPALRRAQHDHRPARALGRRAGARAGSPRGRRATSSSVSAMALVHGRRGRRPRRTQGSWP